MSTTVIQFIRPRGVYEAGFSGSVTVPDGVTGFQAWVQAPGGDGQTVGPIDRAGGGGGFSYFYSDVLESEWGTSLTLSVGSVNDASDGGNCTLSGTLNGAAFSITANGGRRLNTGGTASGGTTNISGSDGTNSDSDGVGGVLGLPGGDGQDLVEPGGTGGLGDAIQAEEGYIALEWA
jgi:hypothetical protein